MKKNAPGCSCCADCDIFADAFGGTLSGWTQVSGSWTISGGEVTVNDSNAVLVCDTAHPDAVAEHYISFDLTLPVAATADEGRGIVAYTDSDNYLFAQVETSSDCATLKLFDRSSGTNTQLGDDVPIARGGATAFNVTVCYDGTNLTAIVTDTVNSITRRYRKAATATGTKVGLGTGNSVDTASFDNFNFDRHLNTTTSVGCPECEIPCLIGSDAFGRSDVDVGCDWTEVSGTWEATGTLLKNTAAGVARYDVPSSDDSTNHRVSATIHCVDAGDIARLVVDYVDASNYHFAEIEVVDTTANIGSLRLFKRDTGTNTQIGATQPIPGLVEDADHVLEVCVSSESIQTSVSPAGVGSSVSFSKATTAHGGKYGGVAVDTVTTQVNFDDFLFHRAGADDACDCGVACSNNCADGEMPSVVKMVIGGLVDDPAGSCGGTDCTGRNGTYILESIRTETQNECVLTLPTTAYGIGGDCYDEYSARVSISEDVFTPGTYHLDASLTLGKQVGFSKNLDVFSFRKTQFVPFDCMSLYQTVLTYDAFSSQNNIPACDPGSVTCTVTALPS